jgi:NAD(P)-dependent dehydrogenase (short-subunit alcohol dehydrogenase family)
VVGFVRSYGKYLPEEYITLNAVCPNVVRTSISVKEFYDNVESLGVLTPMKDVVDAFASFLDNDTSGECMEVGPNGGFSAKAPAPHLDKETTNILQMIHDRSHRLHEPEQ